MSDDLKTRGLVLVTLFSSCIIIWMLLAALTTDYWIETQYWIEVKPHLFLNLKIGPYLNITDVNTLIQRNVIQYTWWLLTTIGVALGLLSSFIGGVASVIWVASTFKKRVTMKILVVSNMSSWHAQQVALIALGIQFYKSLTLLDTEDPEHGWHSTGIIWFSDRFFFVLAGLLYANLNINSLKKATSSASRCQCTDNVDEDIEMTKLSEN